MQNRQIESLADLRAFAEEITHSLKSGENAVVFALHGNLGAGKTTFVQKLAEVLGVTDTVTSPTFAIMKSYTTTHADFTKLVHIDAYRLESPEELEVLKIAEVFADPHTLVCIEWAERVATLLPEDAVHMTITPNDTNMRLIEYGRK